MSDHLNEQQHWGWVGSTRWDILSYEDQEQLPNGNAKGELPSTGLIRETDPVAQFDAGQSPPRGTPIWYELRSQNSSHRRFFLPIPLPDERRLRALPDLVEQLHLTRSAGQLTKGDPNLDELDQLVIALIEWVASVHRTNQPIGLLTPENIFWYHHPGSSDGGSSVVLLPIDWGFRCSPHGAKPDWFADNAPGRVYWDGTPKLMLDPVLDRQRDWRTLARLFSWIATGRVDGSVPQHGDNRIERAPVFETVRAMLHGKGTKPDSLKSDLSQEGNRLSEAFLIYVPPPPPPPPFWRRGWVISLGVVGLLAVIGVAVWFVVQKTEVVPPPFCPECPQDSPLHPLLSKFAAAEEPEQKFEIYSEMWQVSQESSGRRKEIEAACLEKLQSEIFPEEGCPTGSALADPLAKFHALLEPEKLKEFTEIETLGQLLDQLEMVKKAPRSKVPAIREREERCYADAWVALSELFEKDFDIGRFRERYQGIAYDNPQNPIDQKRVKQDFVKKYDKLNDLRPSTLSFEEIPQWLSDFKENPKS